MTAIATAAAALSRDLTATRGAVAGPSGSVESEHLHRLYQRTVADLPWAGVPVTLHLHVRRFVCRPAACPRATFAAPLPAGVAPSARRAVRLAHAQRQLGRHLGGSVAARIAQRHGMPARPTTSLRLVRRTRFPAAAPPPIRGVDEWAYRTRLDVKTILVDLRTNRPREVLPAARATIWASWLHDHPGVTVSARDRAGSLAEGARQGAPNAIPVADRLHLLVRRITHPSIPIADGKGSEERLWVTG